MIQKITALFCFYCLVGFATLQAQPIPKTTFGINGGLILTGSAGATRIEGGRNTLSGTVAAGSQFFFGKSYEGGGIKPDAADFTSEMKPGISAGISFNTMLGNDWEVGISVGKLFGKVKGTFNGIIYFADSTNQDYSGTMESDINGWIFEFGVKHYFDANFHPFVGAGARYSTQNMAGSIISLNGKVGPPADFTGVDEFGGYVNAGIKLPLSESFFFDAEVAGIIRNGTDYVPLSSSTTSKISFEPALRIGISYDIGQYFGTERYGEDDDEPAPKKK